MTEYINLVIAGWVLNVFWGTWIFYRWWSGKNHLITYWNFFIIGSINFIGFGMVQNALGMTAAGHLGAGFEKASWIYISAAYLFYAIAGYVYYRPPRKPEKPKSPQQWWPNDTPATLAVTALALSVIAVVLALLPGFQGAQIFFVAKGPLAIAAFFLGILAAIRYPLSPFILVVLIITGVLGLFAVLTRGGGRRELLALLACVPVAFYWQVLRHRSRKQNLFWLGGIAMAGLVIISAYATIRHQDRGAHDSKTDTAIARIKKLPAAVSERAKNIVIFGEQGAFIDAQNGVWAGMLVINLTTVDNDIDYDWFHCLHFIAVNPIPRAYWPNKPEGLGKILPVMMGERVVNWGPTVVGHCFYDGGWPIVIFYAVLLGAGFRFMDRRIALDPDNPWQLAMMVSVSGHLIGLSRGDCGVFFANILWGLVFVGGVAKIALVLLPRRYYSPYFHPAPLPSGATNRGS
ncbi:MAG: hypothetical protein AAGH99_07400 [Planctomycetota bacterium]